MNTNNDTNPSPKDKPTITQSNSVSGTWGNTDQVYMSNNINPFTVMPLAPNQVGNRSLFDTIYVDTIYPYTNTTAGTIQVKGNMNIAEGYNFTINGQQIQADSIQSDGIVVNATNPGAAGYLTAQFNVTFGGNDTQLLQEYNQATFSTLTGPNAYNLYVLGTTHTSNLAINTAPVAGNVLSIGGNVDIQGDVHTSGTIYIGAVIATTLGVGTTPQPGYTFDVSGTSLFEGLATFTSGIHATGTSYFTGGNFGIGTTNPLYALDVVGSANISANATVGGTTALIGNVGIGHAATTHALDVVGDAYISGLTQSGSLGATGNLDIVGTSRLYDVVTIGPVIPPIGGTQYLNVNGQSTFSQRVTVNGPIRVDATATLGNKFSYITPYLILGGTTFATGTSYPLEVAGTAHFINNILVDETSTLTGNVGIGGAPTVYKLNVTGTSYFSESLTGATSISAGTSLTAGTSINAGTSLAAGTSLTVTTTSTLTGNVGIGIAPTANALEVAGTTKLTGNVGIGKNPTANALDILGTTHSDIITVGTSGTTTGTGLTVYNGVNVGGTSTLTGAVGIGGAVVNPYSLYVYGSSYLNTITIGTSIPLSTVGLQVNNSTTINGNLTVLGTTTLSGTINFGNGNFTTINVANGSILTGNVGIGTAYSGTYILNVLGKSYFTGDTVINGTTELLLNVGIGTAPSASSYILDVLGDSQFTGEVFIGTSGITAGTGLQVYNGASVGGTSTLTGVVTVGTSGITAGTGLQVYNGASVGGTSTLTGVVTVGTSGITAGTGLQVYNGATMGGRVAIGAGPFTVPSAQMEVTGSVVFDNALTVNGLSTFNGGTSFSGSSTFGSISVTGTSALTGVVTVGTSGITTGTGLQVYNGAIIGGTLNLTGTGTALNVTNNASVTGVVTVGTSGITAGTGLTVYNGATIGGTLDVTGKATLGTSGTTTGTGLEVYNGATIGGALNFKIPVETPAGTSPFSFALNIYPTMYIINCDTSSSTVTITSTTSNTIRIGMTFYFVASGTTTNAFTLTYTSLGGSTTTASIVQPKMLTLVCIGANAYSASA